MTTTRHGVETVARRLAAKRTEAIFREAGALRGGHFALKSGRHADHYLEKFTVLQHPALVSELCGLIAARAGADSVDLVAGPTTGGVILAFETARQLGVRGIFAEEVDGGRAFRRGFRVEPGERVLLVDDVLTTGGSLARMLSPVESAGGRIVGCFVLVDRSGGLRELASPETGRTYRVDPLWMLDLPTFDPGPASCPGCSDGVPLETPGASGSI